MKLCLMIIACNEEKYLPYIIKDIDDILDYKILINCNSTDSTKEVAKNMGFDVYDCAWGNDYSRPKNYGITKIPSDADWVLVLDGDERILGEDVYKVATAIDNASSDVGAFVFDYRHHYPYWDSDNDVVAVNLKKYGIAMFRNISGIKYINKVLDDVTISTGYRVKKISATIHHHAFRGDDRVKKWLTTYSGWIHSKDSENNIILDEHMAKEHVKYLNYKKTLSPKFSTIPVETKPATISANKIIVCVSAHFVPAIGGAEKSLDRILRIAVKNGYTVKVLCFLDDNARPFSEKKTFIHNGIEVTQLPGITWPTVHYIDMLSANDGQHQLYYNSTKHIREEIANYIKNNNPGLVVTHLTGSNFVIKTAYELNIKTMLFIQGLRENICRLYARQCKETNLLTCPMRTDKCMNTNLDGNARTIKLADIVVCNSEFTKSAVERFAGDNNNIRHISPIIDFGLYSEQHCASLDGEYILYTRPGIDKGLSLMIKLAQVFNSIKFKFVGTPEKIIPLPNVEYCGNISEDKMPDMYRNAIATIIPSVCQETFSMTAMESMACGTPVIASDQGALPDTIKDGGIIVSNYLNMNEWIDAIRNIRNTSERDRLRKNGLRIFSDYSRSINHDDIMDVFDMTDNVIDFKKKSKKRVLFMGRFFYPPLGGGEYTVKSFLEHLYDNHDYDIGAVCFYDPKDNRPFKVDSQLKWGKINVVQLSSCTNESIIKVLKEYEPDVVVTHSYDANKFLSNAKTMGIPGILGVHFYRNIVATQQFTDMLTRPLGTVQILHEEQKSFSLADKVYVNSEFTKKVVERYVGMTPDYVINPVIDLGKVLSKTANTGDKRYITLVNPDYGKGGRFFIDLARAMPKYNFLCVGQASQIIPENNVVNADIAMTPNITLIRSAVDNMAKVYAETKIMLVPSIVDETFSMVALEAMFNGVPVLATPVGNLPNLVGDSGYCMSPVIDIWRYAIEDMFNNNDAYENLSEKCKQRAMLFAPDKQLEKFAKMVGDLIENSNRN